MNASRNRANIASCFPVIIARRRQVLAAAMTSLKTISLAVFEESESLVRTVRWRTVAKTLSMGLEVRR